ncbi:MAG: AAA family ATPase, partial [Pseudomonadota bacterium]
MRFTRLRLNGFKSFVDPTDLLIADGLTGVVGPNGCGKSNLLEGLRWVMGENRPTAMRGGGMEDVIFAGAASRPARNFAEVSLHIDNGERLAPAGFNDADHLEIVRRITRDAGSAYKTNGNDVRARDVQMLFADASTGAHSPALVRQGQIAELINAKPRARRRILEEAAGISGLYQRRHEAELKLNAAEQNLTRVDDVLESLAQQLATLARQARQAARYRQIGAELRRAEGLLLYLRWAEARDAATEAEASLRACVQAAAAAERGARDAARVREAAEDRLPALREEEAIAAAVLQRLTVERGALDEEAARAASAIETLEKRVRQLGADIDRETGLNRDAGETIDRLEREATDLSAKSEGQEARAAEAAEAARIAGSNLAAREAEHGQLTEDTARLAARHQSAERLEAEAARALTRHQSERETAETAAREADALLATSAQALKAARADEHTATGAAEAAEAALADADAARSEAAGREAEARAAHSAAEGEAQALRAEVAALKRLVERETGTGGQVLDLVGVDAGYEQAIGAALADDLRAPLAEAGGSGWVALPPYDAPQGLPEGATPLAAHTRVPDALSRRIGEVGLVDPADGPRLQPLLKPGQRLVSQRGDLWRWDGFHAAADDAPSAAALRLQQLNRLVELKQDLEEANARAAGAAEAHRLLTERLKDTTEADRAARDVRREADRSLTEASRAVSRAESAAGSAETRREAAEMAVA